MQELEVFTNFPWFKGEKKKEGGGKKESKKEVKVEPEPEPEDLISLVKSRRLLAMQAKKEKEELDRQNKGKPGSCFFSYLLLKIIVIVKSLD